jgi:hypothetical protein
MAKAENGTKKRGRPAKAAPALREPAPPSTGNSAAEQSSAMLGFEYKHVVLGLIFLELLSDFWTEASAG